MAWTTPKSWTIGELVAAATLNEQLRDNLNHLKLIVDDNGKIPALSSTYLTNLSGTNLTGLAMLASGNAFTAGTQNFNGGSGTRVRLPAGANRWAT